MQNLIVPFNDNEITLDQAGGKGLNLCKSTHGGFPIPPGFIVTTEAYRFFTQINRIDAEVKGLYRALSVDDPASVGNISQAIRYLFEAGQMPVDVQNSILSAYRELSTQTGNTSVAVRSSATAEDLPGASFAGQQDTYLNIHGDEALLEAVKRCWASLWSERAMVYRARQAIPPETVALAVVVQQMVPAQSAGVMFTANPVTGARDEMVINVSWGLGEAIVSGLVAPDNLVMDKATGKTKSLVIANKTVMTMMTAHGTQEQAVPVKKRQKRTLNDASAADLVALGLKIEQYYGSPQDIEWCFAGGRFYIVQVRPITALPEPPLSWKAPGKGQWLHGGGTFEMITEPFSPLFETLLLPIFAGALSQMLDEIGLEGVLPAVPYRVVNGHIYLHMALRLQPRHLAGVVRDFALHMNSMQGQATEQTLYHQTVADLTQPAGDELTPAQLLERLDVLGRAGIRYWIQIMKIVQVIYRQEKSFADFYNRYLRRANIPELEIFLRGQKIKPWEAECSMFDLAQLAHKLGLAEMVLAVCRREHRNSHTRKQMVLKSQEIAVKVVQTVDFMGKFS